MERRKTMPNGIGGPTGGGPSIPGGGPSIPGGEPPEPPGPDRAQKEDKEETKLFELEKAKSEDAGQKEDEIETTENGQNDDREP